MVQTPFALVPWVFLGKSFFNSVWNQYTNACTFGTQAFLDFWNQHDNGQLEFRTVYNHITIGTWNTYNFGLNYQS